MPLPVRALLNWYTENSRPLPWRESREPYRIWISEIMLQQTTVKAVLPFFDRFIHRFPNLQALAAAQLDDVYQVWSGLGYYSRARNLHACSQILAKTGFPKSWVELITLPGLGPYTSRAISSLAFSEPVGVLDGNVIRFLSRFHGQEIMWWKAGERAKLQAFADQWVAGFDSHDINQALIEIGATICLPIRPACLLCPVRNYCSAFQSKTTDVLPLMKPRRASEDWLWEPTVHWKSGRVGVTANHELPVLKNHLAWPGSVKRLKGPPKQFDFKHTVTHHNLYVRLKKPTVQTGKLEWLTQSELIRKSPASLIQKVLESHVTSCKSQPGFASQYSSAAKPARPKGKKALKKPAAKTSSSPSKR